MSTFVFACCDAKGCPFCGKHPITRRVGDDDAGYYEVACEWCNGGTGVPFVGAHADTRDKAIEVWNRRVES